MVCVWVGCYRPRGSSRAAPARVLPRSGCAGPALLPYPSPRRSLRRLLSLVPSPPLLIISAVRIPTAIYAALHSAPPPSFPPPRRRRPAQPRLSPDTPPSPRCRRAQRALPRAVLPSVPLPTASRAATHSCNRIGRAGTCTRRRTRRSPCPCSPCRCPAGSRSGTSHGRRPARGWGPACPCSCCCRSPRHPSRCSSCNPPGRGRFCFRRSSRLKKNPTIAAVPPQKS